MIAGKSPMIAANALLVLAACERSKDAANNGGSTNEMAAASATAAPSVLQPGEWETSIEIIKGLSDKIETSGGSYAVTGLVYAPPKLSECLTTERAANPFRRFWFMTGYVDGKNCNYDQFSMDDGKIRGKIDCRQTKYGTEFSLDGQYTPTSYNVVTTTKLVGTETGTNFSVSVPLNWKTTAKRIGECPASSKTPPPPPSPPGAPPPPPPPPLENG